MGPMPGCPCCAPVSTVTMRCGLPKPPCCCGPPCNMGRDLHHEYLTMTDDLSLTALSRGLPII